MSSKTLARFVAKVKRTTDRALAKEIRKNEKIRRKRRRNIEKGIKSAAKRGEREHIVDWMEEEDIDYYRSCEGFKVSTYQRKIHDARQNETIVITTKISW